ncbi:MAG: hypothetical protein AAGE18_04735 [Pseudomonadota bacterium]
MVGFLGRSLLLSVPVALRLLPIILLVAAFAWLFFSNVENPILLLAVLFGGLYPTMAFLVLSGIRAGQMQLRVTTAPSANGLLRAIFRLISANFGLALNVFTIALTPAVAVWLLLDAEALALVRAAIGLDSIALSTLLERAAANSVLLTALVWAAGTVAFALLGVPMAATAANAGSNRPNHEVIWGIGRQAGKLALLSAVFIGLPLMLFHSVRIFVMPTDLDLTPLLLAPEGDPEQALAALDPLVESAADALLLLAAFALYLLYLPCILMAGLARAYHDTVAENEAERAARWDEILEGHPTIDDLHELRVRRQGVASAVEVYVPERPQGAGS